MQLTLKLLDDAITRGWANTAHLSEIRDALRDEATFDLDTLEDKLLALQRKVDDVYSERNSLAVALAKVTLLHGGTAGRGFDNSPDKNWDPEWLNVVYVDVPGVGQVSWHMGPKDLQRLESLPAYTGKWDGTCIGKDPAWPDTIAPLAAAAPSPGPSVMELIGEYWDLGFTEGKTGVNQSDAANELLHRIRRALAQQPAAAAVPAEWPLHDRVEFALRDAGFDYDEASRIAMIAAANKENNND